MYGESDSTLVTLQLTFIVFFPLLLHRLSPFTGLNLRNQSLKQKPKVKSEGHGFAWQYAQCICQHMFVKALKKGGQGEIICKIQIC